MTTKIIHVLCEGQTEQGFVEEVLRPYLQASGITSVKSILITTNKKKNAYGGMLTYSHALTDINLLQQTQLNNDYEQHFFTTMFDLYALPDDFPGFSNSKNIRDPYIRVQTLETAFATAINDKRFIPYIQLHEFEALLFCGIEYIAMRYPGCEKACEQLKKDLQKIGHPELIDNGPHTSPSKRIINAIESGRKPYRYNKPTTGKEVTKNIGMDTLRAQCRHFNEWVEKLINC